MCTNFTPTRKAEWAKASLAVDLPVGYPDECYPSYTPPLVVKGQHSGRVVCGKGQFGLIPHWAKDGSIARHTYNARAKTVDEKPCYRTA